MTESHGRPVGLVLLLHPDDNIVIAAQDLAAGSRTQIDGQPVDLPQSVELGHKLARVPLAAGERILRYGAPIGTMAADAAIGEHVHSHNLKSDYIAAHHRDAVGLRGGDA